MDSVVYYPDPDAVALKQSISDGYLMPRENIEVGNGAVELIYLLCRALAPVRVLLPSPTFGEYEAAALAAGLPVKKILLPEQENFRLSIETYSQQLQPGDLLFFCNPNNPTGGIFDSRHMEPLIARASEVGAHIVVDESFIDFRPVAAEESCRHLIARYPGLTVLHSLTKFLAVPGLRLGFLFGREGLVRRIKSLRDPWNVNVMAQAAGVAGLADVEYRQATVNLIQQEKERIFTGLQGIPGFRPYPPAVNFVLADVGGAGWDAARLQEALWPHKLLIRNCANFTGLSARYMRVAVKNPQDNQRLLSIINKIVCGEDAQ
jgi:threonine-phosphate decarboxylase